MKKPLDGVLVLEFCQFLAGPSAGLKLADLGARVIKIERPRGGDACRQLSIKNLFVEGDSLLFHTINRNKESYAADLKNTEDLNRLKQLIAQADIMIHNFRPGVMDKIGLDYENVKRINPKIIYGVVTGYGNTGPWAGKPGQDLLVQAMSGLTYLSGTKSDGPVPFGLSVSDMMCGNHLAQGLMAALIKHAKTQKSILVEVSLMESILDVQFEVLTTFLNDGHLLPSRSAARESAHAYLSAPYGIYKTLDGYIALAMGDLSFMANLIDCEISDLLEQKNASFDNRDEIMARFGKTLIGRSTAYWLELLERNGVWTAPVLDYKEATSTENFGKIGIRQEINLPNGQSFYTTSCPIRLDQQKLYSPVAAPKLGANNIHIDLEFELK